MTTNPLVAENARERRLRFAVDRDAEHRLALAARLANRHVGILDAVAAFVVIEVVWLAVGDHE